MASNLSQEIIDYIVSYFLESHSGATALKRPHDDFESPTSTRILLSQWSTISRSWQRSVERYTFRALTLTPTRLDDFVRIVHRQRQQHVRHIKVNFVLAPHGKRILGEPEPVEQQQINNEIFSNTVRQTFSILSFWEMSHGGLQLDIESVALRDEMSEDPLREFFPSSRQWNNSYLTLVGEEPLVDVYVVSKLHVPLRQGRTIRPASLASMAQHLVNLQAFKAKLCDTNEHGNELRIQAREDFSKSLTAWPASLKRVELDCDASEPDDQLDDPPVLVRNLEGTGDLSLCVDVFSSNLRVFSQNLKNLKLSGVVIGPDLFWPQPNDDRIPHWPYLEELVVEHKIFNPSGQWLFDADPGENFFVVRDKPVKERFADLYMAAAKAATRMPKLQFLRLLVQDDTARQGLTFIKHESPHWKTFGGYGGFDRFPGPPVYARLRFRCEQQYMLTKDVMDVFAGVADKQEGHILMDSYVGRQSQPSVKIHPRPDR